VDAAVEQGVEVMTFDSDVPNSKRFAFYGADDTDLGEKVAGDLATILGGKGQVAILAATPTRQPKAARLLPGRWSPAGLRSRRSSTTRRRRSRP
jgi:ribose transport system substrate-binding protein